FSFQPLGRNPPPPLLLSESAYGSENIRHDDLVDQRPLRRGEAITFIVEVHKGAGDVLVTIRSYLALYPDESPGLGTGARSNPRLGHLGAELPDREHRAFRAGGTVNLVEEEVLPASDGRAGREVLFELVRDVELEGDRRRTLLFEVLTARNQSQIGDGCAAK